MRVLFCTLLLKPLMITEVDRSSVSVGSISLDMFAVGPTILAILLFEFVNDDRLDFPP